MHFENQFGKPTNCTKTWFSQEGILREEFKNEEGILEDIVYFGLLKSDYKNEKFWQKTLNNEFSPTNELPLHIELYELTNEK